LIYIPKHFEGDAATGRELIAAYPFATLITPAGAEVHVTHVPMLLDESGKALTGHLARPNPHWHVLEAADSVAIFHGPHAFVSRGWYGDPADNVPTWNYATAHVTGRAMLLPVDGNRVALEHLTARFEPAGLPPMSAGKLERLPQGVVAFRLPIEHLEVKLKMSQNRPAEIAGVISGLRAAGDADALATAQWMESHGPG
jgi:transcriptional regulator